MQAMTLIGSRLAREIQFGSDFVAINPNSKIPAMLDQSGDQDIRVFESANILLYLAEKFGKLIPTDRAKRTEVLNWLFWQTGLRHFWVEALGISSTMLLKNRVCHQSLCHGSQTSIGPTGQGTGH